MDRLDKTDSAGKMGSKISMVRTVLALPAVTNAVGKDGFQPVELVARNVQTFVGHKPGNVLADSSPHDSRFVVIGSEA